MNRTTLEEFQELFRQLEEMGWNPRLCNTPVPYIDSGVQAGLPTDHGDFTQGQNLFLPEDLLKRNLTFIIDVKGNSMKDADILPGDRVQIETGVSVLDGDIVIASIDDEYTLKAYFKEGKNQWLLPRNEAYKPILLTEDMKVKIVGKVTSVIRNSPRVSYTEMMKSVKAMNEEVAPEKKEITAEQVEQVIREMGDVVKQIRQWYAVFRAMVDLNLLSKCDYTQFVEKVSVLLPTHKRLPQAAELRRMAVNSFHKSVEDWKSDDAPVSGYRFDTYLEIAKLTKKKLLK